MKAVYLLPQKFKVIGLIMLVPALVFASFVLISDFEFLFLDWTVPWVSVNEGTLWTDTVTDNFTNELAMLCLLVSLSFVAFSKTKEEDEYVQKIRHDSLLWSMYFNYGLLFIGMFFFYGMEFFNIMLISMYTPLFIFVIRFQYYYSKR
jgi:hypothetical protein